MDLRLKGKVAVVTGVGSPKSIGAAMARTLSEEGARLAITDITDEGVEVLTSQFRS